MRKKSNKIKNNKSINELLNEYAESVLEVRNYCDEAYRLLYEAQGKHYYTEADIFPDIFDTATRKNAIVKEAKEKINRVADKYGVQICF